MTGRRVVRQLLAAPQKLQERGPRHSSGLRPERLACTREFAVALRGGAGILGPRLSLLETV